MCWVPSVQPNIRGQVEKAWTMILVERRQKSAKTENIIELWDLILEGGNGGGRSSHGWTGCQDYMLSGFV